MSAYPKKTFALGGALAAVVLALSWAYAAAAQTGINVTPTHIPATIAAGDETREKVSLRNLSAGEVEVEAVVEQGQGEGPLAAVSVAPARIRLAAGESAEVEVHVAVPSDAGVGRGEAYIFFNVADASAGNVAIIGKIRVAVEMNVIRPVSEADFSYPLIIGSGPVTFTMRGRNTSEFPVAMDGRIVLESLLGEDVELVSSSRQVSNDESFELQAVWQDPPLFGIRRLKLSLSSGVGAPVTKTSYILIFSWKLVPALFLLVAAAAILIKKKPAIANVFPGKWRQ
ncbi:MAG: hypothetical protein C4534_06775 [Gaiellales bacterium]|nr:MAG: hypothetical protein C4534_06775 [Gaiellales bacterium]